MNLWGNSVFYSYVNLTKLYESTTELPRYMVIVHAH